MSEPATPPDTIARARLRNESQIAILAIVIGAAAAISASWRLLTTDSGGIGLIALAAVVIVYYGINYVRLRSGRIEPAWALWIRSSAEVSTAFVGSIINLFAVGPLFALTSSTGYIYFFAVALSTLRLNRHLPLFVAALGVAEQLALYFWVRGDPEVSASLALSVPIFSFRLVLLLVTGALGYILARSLRRAAEEFRVRAAFGTYVDHRVVERVLRGDLKLAPERRNITVLFVDIRDFTSLSEKQDPAEVFRLLDTALDSFAADVQKQGGIVNKFLGDGLMALFGTPEPQADHPRRAVRAALRIAESARKMSADGRFPGLRIGIGIHTGEVVTGDIGGQRREYTAIGDVVNVASRVESANKDLGTTILITGDVMGLLGPGADLKAHTPLVLRGRTGSIEVYEVVSLEGTKEIVLQKPLGSL